MFVMLLQDLASPVVQTLLALLYLVLAASVTADVLLTKSDVRSAIGWIAAAWLSPILGGLLYFLFGINRVTRRALKLTRRRGRTETHPPSGEPPAHSMPA